MPRLRLALLLTATALLAVQALGYAFVLLPDLRGDLIELGIRHSVLDTTILYLEFSALVQAGFLAMAGVETFRAMRSGSMARIPLAVVALIELTFGLMAFSQSHSPHHLGPVAAGFLLGVATLIP